MKRKYVLIPLLKQKNRQVEYLHFIFRTGFLITLLICLLTVQSFAGTTGKISGTVTEKTTGEPMPGANVIVDGTPYGSATDLDGYFYILNIPPGTYTVTARMMGYSEVRYTNVRINIDLTTKLDFELDPAVLEGEEVVVIATQPMVQKDLTSKAVNISAEEINALPVDDFNEVVQLQAGVVGDHFLGGRSNEVAYMIDGLPINDPFKNERGIEIENTSIQQLEVISGTFNAEYGQAMSGVVNIITREGGDKYDFDFSAYASNYYTANEDIFPNLDRIDGTGSQNIQVSLSGPIPSVDKLRFFATARYHDDDGHIYGRRLYLPSDSPQETDGAPYNPFSPSGDREYVSMNDSEHLSFHGKMTFFVTPAIKLNVGYLWDDNTNRSFNFWEEGVTAFRLTPDGVKTHYSTQNNFNLLLNQTISNSTFYTLKFSQNYGEYNGYVYKDPQDLRYLDSANGQVGSDFTYRSGGNESDRYKRTSLTTLTKLDINSQVTKIHKLGAGVMFRNYRVNQFWTELNVENSILADAVLYPVKHSPGQEHYIRKPVEFAVYLQDKIEFDNFIINTGIRFDYFDPRTKMPADPRNPELIEMFGRETVEASVKNQVSPRLGVAFPITDQGVIHVSYGHFFQIPNLEQLYKGITDTSDVSKYYLRREARLNTEKGNPDLKSQRTVMYEMGLQQGLTEDLLLEFTAYYRDIRNLVGQEIQQTYDVKQYARFINRDYGNVRGIILSFEKRFADHWGARIDYTYQIAEGNASDPRSVFLDSQSNPPREPEKKLVLLNWDQRSTLNIALNTGNPGRWNVGLIGKFGSGQPYTNRSQFTLGEVAFRNNRVKPSFLVFDLKAEKTFSIANSKVTTFLWVENLLDRLNVQNVYGSTGEPDNDLDAVYWNGIIYGLHTLDYYVKNPANYHSPRRIRLGMSVGF